MDEMKKTAKVGITDLRPGKADADIASFMKAGKTLDRLLAAQGVDVEEVVAAFNTARKRAGASKRPTPTAVGGTK
jgi:hypothetical protein